MRVVPRDIIRVLETGTSEAKINALESLDSIDDHVVLSKMIELLNDSDIRVRGEAFAALTLNSNDITEILLRGLRSESVNARSCILLVLANREEKRVIPKIIHCTDDTSSVVRSCAAGALRHLGATNVEQIFYKLVSDPKIEVRESALYGLIDLEIPVPPNIEHVIDVSDPLIARLVQEWTGRDLNP